MILFDIFFWREAMSFAEFAAIIIYLYVAIDFFWCLAVLDIGGAFEHKLVLLGKTSIENKRFFSGIARIT